MLHALCVMHFADAWEHVACGYVVPAQSAPPAAVQRRLPVHAPSRCIAGGGGCMQERSPKDTVDILPYTVCRSVDMYMLGEDDTHIHIVLLPSSAPSTK
eukprot:300568-Chlamydomonas_euryale.AAC.2